MSGAYKYRPQYTQNTIGPSVSGEPEVPSQGAKMDHCEAVNAVGHRCAWEKGHEQHSDGLDKLLIWNGKRVHGWCDPRGFWEIWSVAKEGE